VATLGFVNALGQAAKIDSSACADRGVWNVVTAYGLYDLVSHSNHHFIANGTSTGVQPSIHSDPVASTPWSPVATVVPDPDRRSVFVLVGTGSQGIQPNSSAWFSQASAQATVMSGFAVSGLVIADDTGL
jgi:hypothetical protein